MRHPLAAYLLLAFAITWLFWVPLAILYDGGSDLGSLLGSPLVIVLQTLGVTGPLISAIVVTGLTRGKRGVRGLLGGLKRWRVGLWWYAAACLLIPVLTVIGIGVRGMLGVDPAVPDGSELAAMLADIGWIGLVLTFPLQLLLQCFGSPLLEEPGWRGFALPQVRKRMPAAWAAPGRGNLGTVARTAVPRLGCEPPSFARPHHHARVLPRLAVPQYEQPVDRGVGPRVARRRQQQLLVA